MPVNNPPIPSIPDDLVQKPTSITSNGLYWFATEGGNNIIRANNKTFVFYMGDDYDEWCVVLDHETNTWGSPVSIADGHTSNDPHFYVSAAIDSSGYFYIAYGCHDSDLYYKKSTNPYDVSAWSGETVVGNLATYPKWIVDSSDNLYLFYRTGYVGGLGSYLAVKKSTDNGATFSAATIVVSSGDPNIRIYDGLIGLGSDDSIHISWVWRTGANPDPTTAAADFYDVEYAKTLDGGTTWKKSDGSSYTLPISPAAAEDVATGIRKLAAHVALDQNNNPLVLYVQSDAGVYFTSCALHYCYLSGGVWQDITLEGTSFDSTAHILVDGITFYIFGTKLIGGSWEAIMFRSINSGTYWTYHQLTSDSIISNVQLESILSSAGGLELVWTKGDDSSLLGISEFSSDIYYVDFSWIEMLYGDIDRGNDVVNIVGDSTGTSSTIINTYARGLREAGGPTILPMGGVLANQYLKDIGGYISGSVPTFLELSDTPSSYSGQGGKYAAVKSDASGLEFVTAPSGGGGSGLVIYDDEIYKATGTAISFDNGLDVIVTGSVVFVSSNGIVNTNGFLVQDEGVLLGTGTTLNFVGNGVISSISGSIVQVLITGSNVAGTILGYGSLLTGTFSLPTGAYSNVDSTSLSATFIVPPSGKVLIEMDAYLIGATFTFQAGMNLMSGTTSIVGTDQTLIRVNATAPIYQGKHRYSYIASGLLPGASITWKMGAKALVGTGSIGHNSAMSLIKIIAL